MNFTENTQSNRAEKPLEPVTPESVGRILRFYYNHSAQTEKQIAHRKEAVKLGCTLGYTRYGNKKKVVSDVHNANASVSA